jgi:hypothetical protein
MLGENISHRLSSVRPIGRLHDLSVITIVIVAPPEHHDIVDPRQDDEYDEKDHDN